MTSLPSMTWTTTKAVGTLATSPLCSILASRLLPPWLQGAVSAPQLGLGALALGILVSLAGLLASAPGVVAALAVLLPLSAFFGGLITTWLLENLSRIFCRHGYNGVHS